MRTTAFSHTLLALVTLATLTSARPGDVWVVDEAGTADFTDIQAAVSAAQSGDTLLILPGLYSGFTVDDKSLSIAGDTPQFIRVNGAVVIQGITAPDSVTLSGINIRLGMLVTDCSGHVGIAGCSLERVDLNMNSSTAEAGQHVIQNCEDVVFSRSTLRGRDGGSEIFCAAVLDGFDGESAVALRNSRVAFYSCDIFGGKGGPSADGTCGFWCDYGIQANGGDGVNAQEYSFVYFDDTYPTRGLKGDHLYSCWSLTSEHGVPVSLDWSSSMEVAAAPVLSFDAADIVREDDLLALEVSGPSGAVTWMLWSDSSTWRPFGGALGLLHVDSQTLVLQSVGTIPASGVLNASLTPPPVLAGMEARRIFIQVFALDSGAGRLLGTSTGLDILDSAF